MHSSNNIQWSSLIADTDDLEDDGGGAYASVAHMEMERQDQYYHAGGAVVYENPQIIVRSAVSDRVMYLRDRTELIEHVTKNSVKDIVFFDRGVNAGMLMAACEAFNESLKMFDQKTDYIDWMYALRYKMNGMCRGGWCGLGEADVKNVIKTVHWLYGFGIGYRVTKRNLFIKVKDVFKVSGDKMTWMMNPSAVIEILKWWGYEMSLDSVLNIGQMERVSGE